MSVESQATSEQNDSEETLYPAVAMYGPMNVRGLKEGEVKMWCRCGLGKKQPWCDGSHVGSGIKPLKWTVPHTQSLYQVCVCKYSKHPPLCDGSHTNLPCDRKDRIKACKQAEKHTLGCKLCTGCGWVLDF